MAERRKNLPDFSAYLSTSKRHYNTPLSWYTDDCNDQYYQMPLPRIHSPRSYQYHNQYMVKPHHEHPHHEHHQFNPSLLDTIDDRILKVMDRPSSRSRHRKRKTTDSPHHKLATTTHPLLPHLVLVSQNVLWTLLVASAVVIFVLAIKEIGTQDPTDGRLGKVNMDPENTYLPFMLVEELLIHPAMTVVQTIDETIHIMPNIILYNATRNLERHYAKVIDERENNEYVSAVADIRQLVSVLDVLLQLAIYGGYVVWCYACIADVSALVFVFGFKNMKVYHFAVGIMVRLVVCLAAYHMVAYLGIAVSMATRNLNIYSAAWIGYVVSDVSKLYYITMIFKFLVIGVVVQLYKWTSRCFWFFIPYCLRRKQLLCSKIVNVLI